MASETDHKLIEETIQQYLALGAVQLLVGLGLFICPTLSLATTTQGQISPGHIYALSVMVLIQATMHLLIFKQGKGMLANASTTPNPSGNAIGCYVTVGIFIGFPEFATTIVTFVITGLFYSDVVDEINRKLALAVLVLCGIALVANVFTIFMGCTRAKVLGVKIQNRNRRVRTQNMVIITTNNSRQQGGMNSNATASGQTSQIQALQLQNSLLQQQMLQQQLQQQQQSGDQQRFANYGFPSAPPPSYPPPSALYSGNADPAYPPAYSQPEGPPPEYQPK